MNWTVGECKEGKLHFQDFQQEQDARDAFSIGFGRWSRVLFGPDGQPEAFSCVGSDGVDGAFILRAYKQGRDCGLDRKSVAEDVEAGREPFLPPDRSLCKQWLMKRTMQLCFWNSMITRCASHPLRTGSLCCVDNRLSPGVRGYVALTIDDAPCRFGRSHSRVKDVQKLLESYNAHATFMVIGSFVDGHEADLVELLQGGHEFGNHGMLDRSYETNPNFAKDVDRCTEKILELQRSAGVPEGVEWFRAPHGRYTQAMHDILQEPERNLTNVMTSAYASCPIVQDGDFIGGFLARNVSDGGIIVLHMPEKGHREWCLLGLERMLHGLEQRGLRAVTVGKLMELADAGGSGQSQNIDEPLL